MTPSKILYIGNFLDSTGWSHASNDYVLALDSVGVEVYPRNIKLNNVNGQVSDRMRDLMQGKHHGGEYRAVIQAVLPHMLDYNGRVPKCVAQYYTETDSFASSTWPLHINLFDQALVSCEQNKEASIRSGVKTPISVVPCATDVSKFQKKYPKSPIRDLVGDHFTFYTVGEFNKRKNLKALMTAFHLEFTPHEPVELFIKTTPVGISVDDVINLSKDIKTGLKLYPKVEDYKEELVTVEYWTDEQIMSLHSSMDCFVTASYGEAWGLDCFTAMGMGKAVVASRYGGFLQYLNDENSWLVEGRMQPCEAMFNTFIDLYTGRENWFSVDVLDLRRAMREAYENRELRKQKGLAGMARALDFSYNKIGTKMKEALEIE